MSVLGLDEAKTLWYGALLLMNVERFRFHHPVLYRRLLEAACGAMVVAGLLSVPAGSGSAVGDIALSPPKPQPTLTRLPGRDGSTPHTEMAKLDAKAATPTPVAARALTVAGDERSLGRTMNAMKFGESQWPALEKLWTRESNWNPHARNRRSGACGIPQALPCSKIPDMSPQGQISWGLSYIQTRYGSPAAALAHSNRYGWY